MPHPTRSPSRGAGRATGLQLLEAKDVQMSYRISPAWWPIIGLSSPVLIPMLLVKNGRYKQNIAKSLRINKERMERAVSLASENGGDVR